MIVRSVVSVRLNFDLISHAMNVYDWFWSETFWFPEGKSWKDLQNDVDKNIYLPRAIDLHWALPIGLVLLFVRYAFERFILFPLGYLYGVKKKKSNTITVGDPVLEGLFKKNGFVSRNNLESVAKQTDMSVREVEVWLRRRRKLSVTAPISKFAECGWHCAFYIFSVTFGLITLWHKPWFSELKYCWKDWPKMHIANDVYWYYLIEMSYYWCLMFSLATDHKRKDWKEMTLHHCVTIALLYFSWVMNFVRVGSLILILHDTADIPLNLCKCAKYAGQLKQCDYFLCIFIPVWTLTRLIIYPFWILNSSTFEVKNYIQPFCAYYLFNILLIALQLLHLMWSYMIAKIAINDIKKGKFEDVRSDNDSEEE